VLCLPAGRSVLWSLRRRRHPSGERFLSAQADPFAPQKLRGKREANGKKESACFVRNDGLGGARMRRGVGKGGRACAPRGMRRDVGNGDRDCARCLPGQWLEIIGEVASCGIERVDQGCGDFRVCTRAFGAVLRQAASMARCSVALLTDFSWTVVLPFRPQAPAAGMKAFGSS
jgi:hypothetical protein